MSFFVVVSEFKIIILFNHHQNWSTWEKLDATEYISDRVYSGMRCEISNSHFRFDYDSWSRGLWSRNLALIEIVGSRFDFFVNQNQIARSCHEYVDANL